MTGQPDVARVRELSAELVRLAEAEPQKAGQLAARLERLLTGPAKRARGGRGNRRPVPVLDPFEIYRDDPGSLPGRLGTLELEQLRDLVAHHGMDPRRLVMKWKDPAKVVAHIIETVELRSRKGDVFRGPPPPSR